MRRYGSLERVKEKNMSRCIYFPLCVIAVSVNTQMRIDWNKNHECLRLCKWENAQHLFLAFKSWVSHVSPLLYFPSYLSHHPLSLLFHWQWHKRNAGITPPSPSAVEIVHNSWNLFTPMEGFSKNVLWFKMCRKAKPNTGLQRHTQSWNHKYVCWHTHTADHKEMLSDKIYQSHRDRTQREWEFCFKSDTSSTCTQTLDRNVDFHPLLQTSGLRLDPKVQPHVTRALLKVIKDLLTASSTGLGCLLDLLDFKVLSMDWSLSPCTRFPLEILWWHDDETEQ